MRITQSTLSRQFLNDTSGIAEKIFEYQRQVSSGKRVEKPSDDPVAIPQILSNKTGLAQLNQYKQNILAAQDWLSSTSLNLAKIEDIGAQITNLGHEGLSDLISDQQRNVLADQVNQYLDDMLSYANAASDGKYIFGGTQTDTPPFIATRDAQGHITAVTQNPAGTGGDIQRAIGPGQQLSINSKGGEVFQPNGAGLDGDMFAVLISVRDSLDNNDLPELADKLAEFQGILNLVTQENSNVGTTINRLQSAQDRLQQEVLNSTEQLSRLQDTDYAEALMKYQTQQQIYQTALAMGSKLLGQSLVNYI